MSQLFLVVTQILCFKLSIHCHRMHPPNNMWHNLTQGALDGFFLQLIRLCFLSPNLCPISLDLLNKHTPVLKDPMDFTYICCLQEISDKKRSTCPNVFCGYSLASEQGQFHQSLKSPWKHSW